jgi:hypothetical protein
VEELISSKKKKKGKQMAAAGCITMLGDLSNNTTEHTAFILHINQEVNNHYSTTH